MNLWSLNTACKSNEQSMLLKNRGYIGLGEPYENREEKKGNTTIKQLVKFKNIAKKNDYIFLYKNKIGFIAYGKYTGEVFTPQFNDEFAPGWNSSSEKQCHLGIDQWISFMNPIKTNHFNRTTLSLIKNNELKNQLTSLLIY